MKKIALYSVICSMIVLGMGFVFNACVDEKEEAFGSIYGIVTKDGTTEVMQGIGIELYRDGNLLLKSVTFSDGHYEFIDLKAGSYRLKIVSDGWEQTEYSVLVEGGRQARQDMQVKKLNTHMTVRTMNATDQNGTTATLNGYVSYDNTSYKPTEVGFYYSTTTEPLSGIKVKGGLDSTMHSFNSQISNLSFGLYYVQAYGINSLGISYGDIKTFEMTNFPVVETRDATNILAESATLNGYIVSEGDPAYTERGFVYSKSYNTPTVDDPENSTTRVVVPGTNKEFSANISSLAENSTYYIRAFAKHAKGTVYGAIKTIVPKAILPHVTTLRATNVLSESATLNGRINGSGEPPYTERGFIYSTSYKEPTLNDPSSATLKIIVPGLDKEFTVNLDSLITGTTYYVRAYASSTKGVAYGDAVSFTPTAVLPVVTTLAVTNLLSESVMFNGRIDNVGEPAYTERGFIYSTSYENPTLNDPSSATFNIVVPGQDINFSYNLDNLTTGKIYYMRAYAISRKGVSYGDVVPFTPTAVLPVVRTLAVTNLLAESATLNGQIDAVGEPPYTERGFVYTSSNVNPMVNDPSSVTQKVVVPGTDKKFSANISSLSTGTKYSVRAYAITTKGVAYGDSISFVPKAIMPVVVTLPVSNILAESATLNGRIDNVGEPAYTERGFVYSKSYETPTIDDPSSATTTVVVSGSGNEFSANINELTTGKSYYARAYAKSTKGIAYGSVVSFKPESSEFIVIENANLMVQKADLASAATWEQAKTLCQNSTVGGYNDWRLPTITEFNILYTHKDEIGGFSNFYWSSTMSSDHYSNRKVFSFFSNIQYDYHYNSTWHVRAVRTIK